MCQFLPLCVSATKVARDYDQSMASRSPRSRSPSVFSLLADAGWTLGAGPKRDLRCPCFVLRSSAWAGLGPRCCSAAPATRFTATCARSQLYQIQRRNARQWPHGAVAPPHIGHPTEHAAVSANGTSACCDMVNHRQRPRSDIHDTSVARFPASGRVEMHQDASRRSETHPHLGRGADRCAFFSNCVGLQPAQCPAFS